MAKRAGAYRGEKRRKELDRIKKQEEKRQRRQHQKDAEKGQGPPIEWAEPTKEPAQEPPQEPQE